MRRRNGGGWVSTLTPAQRQRVYDALDRRRTRIHGYRDWGGYSLLLDRSVGVPRSIILRRRNGAGQIVEDTEVDATP